CLRLPSGSPPAQWVSIRMLRPWVQPKCRNSSINALVSIDYSESPAVAGRSTPTRRTCSRCCARAVKGHAAAPPNSVMNSRRLIADPRGSQGIVAAQTCTGKDPDNVRFGSEADMCSAPAHVRFTPESDIKCDSSFCGGRSAQRLGLNQKHQVANLQWLPI